MPTRLFLQDAANALSGTFPSGEQSVLVNPTTTAPNMGTLRTMGSLTGTAMVTRTLTGSATLAAQIGFCGFFCSPTLDVNQVIPPQPLLLNIANRESSASMNFGGDLRINAYVWRPSTGAKVGTLVDNLGMTGDIEPAALSIRTNIASVTSTITLSANAGDVIICEVYQHFTQAVATALSGAFYYGGTTVNTTNNTVVTNHASFFELGTTTLTFGTPPVLSISGAYSNTLGAVTLAGTGTSPRNGSFNNTLATVALSGAGAIRVQGTASPNLAAATLAGAGTVGLATISAAFSNTLAAVALAGTGTSPRNAAFNNALATVALSGAGTVPVVGNSSKTLAAAALSATGAIPVVGAATPNLAAATLTGAGTLPIIGTADNTLTPAALVAANEALATGGFSNSLDSVTLSAAGTTANQPPVPQPKQDDSAGSSAHQRRKFVIPQPREEVSVLDRIYGVEETPSVPDRPARPKHMPLSALATAIPAASFTQPPTPVVAPDYSDDELLMLLLLAI